MKSSKVVTGSQGINKKANNNEHKKYTSEYFLLPSDTLDMPYARSRTDEIGDAGIQNKHASCSSV